MVNLFSDMHMMCYIHRVNLDLIWSWYPGTKANTKKDGLLRSIQTLNSLNVHINLHLLGLYALGDELDFRVALGQLRY